MSVATQVLPAGADEFLGALSSERGLSANTVAAYRSDLAQYFDTLDGREPSAEAVSRFVASLRTRGLRPTTVARKISTVKGYHRFLLTEGLADDDPTVLIDVPVKGLSLPKALTVDEAVALVEAPNRSTPLGSRDAAILEFLYASGSRVSEAVGLDTLDIDFETSTAVVTGKGDKQRIVPLGRHARQSIAAYLPHRQTLIGGRRDPGKLYVNARGGALTRQGAWLIVRKHARLAGIDRDGISPHILRHSAATHMVEGGADLRTVQEILGHASISTTQVYTRVSPQHLLEVFVTSHPRERR